MPLVAAAGPMVGARMVLPGPYLDGENIFALMDTYKVTISTGQGGGCCCSGRTDDSATA